MTPQELRSLLKLTGYEDNPQESVFELKRALERVQFQLENAERHILEQERTITKIEEAYRMMSAHLSNAVGWSAHIDRAIKEIDEPKESE